MISLIALCVCMKTFNIFQRQQISGEKRFSLPLLVKSHFGIIMEKKQNEVRSMNGCRVADHILSLVPDAERSES